MRTRFGATCIVVLVVAIVGWTVLKQGTKGKDEGATLRIETATNTPDPTSKNTIRHAKLTPIASPTNAGISNVIRSYSQEKSDWKGLKNTAIRSRKIELTPDFFDNIPEKTGSTLSLQLFDDVQIDADVSGSFTNINGTISTTAGVVGSRFGRVFIAKTGHELRAKITIPETGKLYAIHYNPADRSHYALELDLKAEQIDDVGEHPVAPVAQNDQVIQDSGLSDTPTMLSDESITSTVVDIMIVYSNDALSDSGSIQNVNNLISLAMMYSNDAHTNTGTGIMLNLIHSEQVNYDDSGDWNTDLDRLTNTTDGYIDTVHTLRNTYGADFVCLMVGDYTTEGGVAWLLTSTNGNAAYAFSVITQSAMDSYAPVHEIGHNMGLSHARDQSVQPGPTSWSLDDFGFGTSTAGWHWHPTPGADGYCTVMPYTSGVYYDDGLDHIRIGLFSDPEKTDNAMACGDVDNGDNARVLRAMKSVYAAYYTRSLPDNTIVVDAPNGGEYWTAEDTYNINWYAKDVIGNVKIELYQNGNFHSTIAANTLNDRIYTWTIPSGKYGSGFRIRVTSIDNDSIFAVSDADFTIATPFYSEPLDSDPGYTTTGQWEFGEPLSGNITYGGPGSAYTGTYIYDTDLDDTYTTTSYLTSTAIDCSAYKDIRLRCMAQISVSSDSTASIQVSSDGSTWSTLYAEPNLWQTAWAHHEYDISSTAEGQSTVYIRWAIDHTQGSLRSGFAVDDIRITGIRTMPLLSISDVTVTEGDAGPVNANFIVSLDETSINTITVNYTTAGNTATSDIDFTADSGTITFDPGEVTKTITILVQGDTMYETDETYYVNLSNPTNVAIADNQGVGTIINDDTIPTVTLRVDTNSIAEAGGIATITATLSNETAEAVTVNLGYTGTADGSDYTPSAASIVISSGTSGTATITATEDSMTEGDESVIIDILHVTNGTDIGAPPLTIIIIDDINGDFDGDGMPNGWESANGLNPAINDSANDPDGDGYTNLQEYLAGTNPQACNPIADAGPDQTVAQGASVSLFALNTTDADGVIDTYLWEQIAGSVVTLSDASTATPAFTAPNHNNNEALIFLLTVTDNDDLTHTDTCIVNVIADENIPPTAVTGPNQIVAEGLTVTLDGSDSLDPENGTPVTWLWEQTAGTSVSLSDKNAVFPIFSAPEAGKQVLAFTLTVTDNDGLKDSDQCLINVTNSTHVTLPMADAGNDQTVEEGIMVTLNGTDFTETKADAPSVFLWTQTSGLPVTLSDPASIEPTFVAPSVGIIPEDLQFTLTVTDKAGLKNTDQCKVSVTNGNTDNNDNNPPTADAGDDQIVVEGLTVTLNGAGSGDPEDGTPSSWHWTQTGGLQISLSDSFAVKPSFVAPPVDTDGVVLSFQLTVTDSAGLESTDVIHVTVNNAASQGQDTPPSADDDSSCFIATFTGH